MFWRYVLLECFSLFWVSFGVFEGCFQAFSDLDMSILMFSYVVVCFR